MKLDPRHLRYLRSVAEHGSFSHAAGVENISQPALSNKIALLEQQLGVRIIERGRHGATLNDFGTILLRYARALDALMQQAQDEIDLKKLGYEGPLVIGGTPVTLVELAPMAAGRLASENRRISISIIEGDDEDLIEKLRAGEIELMLSSGDPGTRHPEFEHELLLRLPIEAVVGASNSLAARRVMSLEQLADQQWVFPAADSMFRRQIEAIFLNCGVGFPVSHWSCNSLMSLKTTVQNSNCVSIMPRHAFAREVKAGLLHGIRLRNISANRAIGIMTVKARTLSPLANRYIVALREVARGIH